MFRNALDIMLFKGFRQQAEKEEAEKAQECELKLIELSQPTPDGEADEKTELDVPPIPSIGLPELPKVEVELKVQVPAATAARERTLEKIKVNSQIEVKKEASELLTKSLQAIHEAIKDEKFQVELGGPGRPDPGFVVLSQAYGNYRPDSREITLGKLREAGYRVEEVDNIFIRISW